MDAFELIFIGNVKINNSLKDTSKQGKGMENNQFTSNGQGSDSAHLRLTSA